MTLYSSVRFFTRPVIFPKDFVRDSSSSFIGFPSLLSSNQWPFTWRRNKAKRLRKTAHICWWWGGKGAQARGNPGVKWAESLRKALEDKPGTERNKRGKKFATLGDIFQEKERVGSIQDREERNGSKRYWSETFRNFCRPNLVCFSPGKVVKEKGFLQNRSRPVSENETTV